MLKIAIYNQQGEKTGEKQLNEVVFGVKVKPEVIHEVVVGQMANLRQPLAHTKTRSEVRGGGRKPWRQKGTGRARHGSIRSPLWIGGGVTFGPRKERNYKVKINKKVRRKAIFMILSDKVADNRLILLDKIELPEAKTKKLWEILKILNEKIMTKVDDSGEKKQKDKKNKKTKKEKLPKVMIVLGEKKEEFDKMILRSARNLPVVSVSRFNSLNLLDLLRVNYLICEEKTIDSIEKLFLKK